VNVVLDHVSVRDAPAHLPRAGTRILLDRQYIEVGQVDEPLLFLRPDDIVEAARLLGREPRPYVGRDGEWLDVEVAGPVSLTRRTAPPGVAAGWPPPRLGAGRLEEVRVRGDAAPLLDPLEALGVPPPGLVVEHAPGEPLRVIAILLADGTRVL
jgi:hypothetical protein